MRQGVQFHVPGSRNFERHYRSDVDDWALYHNAGAVPELIAWGENI